MASKRGVLLTATWVAVWLVTLDLAAGWAFTVEARNRPGMVGRLARYFEHGLSTEARLRRALADPSKQAGAMLRSGWIDPERWSDEPSEPAAGQVHLAAVYGNSFARQVGRVLPRIDSGGVGVRMVFGPVAPPSHSYASYLADRGLHRADVVVLGVVSSTMAGILSMTRATQSVMEPSPYTYPRYRLAQGRLESVLPILARYEDLVAAMGNPEMWRRHAEQLSRQDAFYSASLFNASVLDHSILARMLRSAWAIRRHRLVEERVHDRNGFHEDSEAVELLEAMLSDFSRRALADGQRPLVLLMSTSSGGDDLGRVLREKLASERISAVYSQDVCRSDDPRSFEGDGHFSKACAEAIGERVVDWIEAS